MKILVVDDQYENLYLLERQLSAKGHAVVSARNGVEALDKLEQGPFDLIISDILMPQMDGFQLCRQVKTSEAYRQIPFIFYTATYTDSNDEKVCMSLGASRFIIKPQEPDSFMATINDVLKEKIVGSLPPPAPEIGEKDYLKTYNERLIQKLESKVQQYETAARELRASEEQYRLLFEDALTGDYLSTVEGRILACNAAFVRMFGFASKEEAQACNISMLYVDRQSREELLERLRREHRLDRHETEMRRKDGSTLHAIRNVIGIFNAGGQLVQTRGYIFDITESKRLEEQFRQSQKMEAIGRLAGAIAHDFNNLITVILCSSGLMMRANVNPDAARRNIKLIFETGERAGKLTRQLLQFSRQQILSPRILDLNSLLGEMRDLLERLIGENINVVMKLNPDLGKVLADPGQIQQVIMNLYVNARDAMPRGGTLIVETANVVLDDMYCRTHVEAKPGRHVMFAISDTGCGMDEKVRSRIFEPFFTTKELGKGTGLGLSTAFGIIKQAGGHILVYSEVERGTTFKFYLPEAAAGVGDAGSSASFKKVSGGGETILVSEDEAGIRELLKNILADKGYQVIVAMNPEDAIRKSSEHAGPIHLLITDVVMPIMNGRELAKHLSATRPDMKVLFMSGYTSDAIVHHGVVDQGINFLEKPFTLDSVARKIREVIDQE